MKLCQCDYHVKNFVSSLYESNNLYVLNLFGFIATIPSFNRIKYLYVLFFTGGCMLTMDFFSNDTCITLIFRLLSSFDTLVVKQCRLSIAKQGEDTTCLMLL